MCLCGCEGSCGSSEFTEKPINKSLRNKMLEKTLRSNKVYDYFNNIIKEIDNITSNNIHIQTEMTIDINNNDLGVTNDNYEYTKSMLKKGGFSVCYNNNHLIIFWG